jgi:hypothetical protein
MVRRLLGVERQPCRVFLLFLFFFPILALVFFDFFVEQQGV